MNNENRSLVEIFARLAREMPEEPRKAFVALLQAAKDGMNELTEFHYSKDEEAILREHMGLAKKLFEEIAFHFTGNNHNEDSDQIAKAHLLVAQQLVEQEEHNKKLRTETDRLNSTLSELKEEARYLKEITEFESLKDSLGIRLDEWPYCLDVLKKRFNAVVAYKERLQHLEASTRNQFEEIRMILKKSLEEENNRCKAQEKKIFQN